MYKLLIACALISTVTALECQMCQTIQFKDESLDETMGALLVASGSNLACNDTMKATCPEGITKCASMDMDVALVLNGIKMDISLTTKMCDSQVNGVTVLTCETMEAAMKAETDSPFQDMKNCKISNCESDMCNLSGANTVYASIALLTLALLRLF